MLKTRTTCVIVAAVACAAVTTATQASGPASPKSPPDRGSAPAAAKRYFGAFSRPDARPVDGRERARLASALKSMNADLDETTLRLLQEDGATTIYAAVGTSSVCTIVRQEHPNGRIGGAGCGRAEDDDGLPLVHGSVTVGHDDQFIVGAVVPDGYSSFVLRFDDSSAITLSPENNTLNYFGSRRPVALEYTDSRGGHHSDDYSVSTGPPGG